MWGVRCWVRIRVMLGVGRRIKWGFPHVSTRVRHFVAARMSSVLCPVGNLWAFSGITMFVDEQGPLSGVWSSAGFMIPGAERLLGLSPAEL